jgi:regulator of protease activity HflC (stomatin/prohibitin superfamily)
LNWFQALVDFLTRFWPFEIVHSYERGVRFWLGTPSKEPSSPGLKVFVPWFGSVATVEVMPDILKLFNQNVTTKDGKSLMISANIRYEITDAVAAHCNVQDYKDNLADEARTHIATQVRELNYEELLHDQTAFEKSCKKAISPVVKEWGVKIIRVGLADFIVTKNFSLANV